MPSVTDVQSEFTSRILTAAISSLSALELGTALLSAYRWRLCWFVRFLLYVFSKSNHETVLCLLLRVTEWNFLLCVQTECMFLFIWFWLAVGSLVEAERTFWIFWFWIISNTNPCLPPPQLEGDFSSFSSWDFLAKKGPFEGKAFALYLDYHLFYLLYSRKISRDLNKTTFCPLKKILSTDSDKAKPPSHKDLNP